MSQPRTYAELRQQWLQRVAPDVDFPQVRLETSLQVLQAVIDQLQRAPGDPEPDPDAIMVTAPALDVESAIGSQEEMSALIEMARTARTVRGPNSRYIEEAALRALVEIADERVVPFLAESYHFSRPHDGSAGHRRSIVLKGIATFAVLSRNVEALAILEEALDHKTARIRLAACRAVMEVASMTTLGLPTPLATHLAQVARADRASDVRVSAALALEAAGHFPEQGA